MGLIISIFVGLILVVIGIVQISSKEPVGFYTGEELPKATEIKDVKAWNLYHGLMFVIYGVIIIICYLIADTIDQMVASSVIYTGAIVIPIPLLVVGHKKLEKKYRIKDADN